MHAFPLHVALGVYGINDAHSLNVVYGWRLQGVIVYILAQPTLIKIDFFVSKCMLSIWLWAQQGLETNPYPLEQSPAPLRSCCDYNIEQIPLPPKGARGTGGGSRGRPPYRGGYKLQKNLHWIPAAFRSLSCSPSCCLPLSPPQRHHGARGTCSSRPSAAESQTVWEYWIIFPPLLWVVGEGINSVLVNSSKSSRRRCSSIIRASPCMFCSNFFQLLLFNQLW